MEQENIESSYPEQDLQTESSANEGYESGNDTEDSAHDSPDTENTPQENYDYVDGSENETDQLKRELQELKERQYQYEQQMRQHSQKPFEQPEQEQTVTDIVRNAIQDIEREQYELASRNAQAELDAKFHGEIQRFKGKVKDFDSVVGKVYCTPAMLEMIKSSDNPGAIAYNASKFHASDLQRIAALPNPQAQFREMVLLEQKIKESFKPKTVSRSSAPLSETAGSAGLSNNAPGPNTSTADLARIIRDLSKKR